MAAKSSSSDSSTADPKLVRISSLDSEQCFELKTTLISDCIYYCVSELNSNVLGLPNPNLL